jgi:hypothetical protein
MPERAMCEKCVRIDIRLEQLMQIGLLTDDQQARGAIAALIEELVREKKALHEGDNPNGTRCA